MASEHGWKSPYHKTPAVGRFLGFYQHRSIIPHVDDARYTVPYEWVHRPDLAALDMYGDSDLWIAIPLRNGLEDPVFDMTYGRVIYVPPLTHVIKSLGG